jgi:Ankyrin repeats (3 copies)
VLKDLIPQSNPNPHDRLTAICMARLRHHGFQVSDIASEEELDAVLVSAPLLDYAYHSWYIHGRESVHEPAAHSRLSTFVRECHAFPIVPGPRAELDRFGPLHVIAAFDLPLSLAGPDQLRTLNQASDNQRLTPLHVACMQNSRVAVKELLALPRILVNAPDKDGSTPLAWASMSHTSGDADVVKLLLSHSKIKVNQANEYGLAALHCAASAGRADIVKLLLAHPKIKVNQADASGVTPFIFACSSASMDVETVKLFLAHPKVNVNAADKNGTTALMWMMVTVASMVPIDMIKAILAHPKIDPNLWDKGGQSTAYWIQRSRRQDIIDIFKAHPRFRLRR